MYIQRWSNLLRFSVRDKRSAAAALGLLALMVAGGFVAQFFLGLMPALLIVGLSWPVIVGLYELAHWLIDSKAYHKVEADIRTAWKESGGDDADIDRALQKVFKARDARFFRASRALQFKRDIEASIRANNDKTALLKADLKTYLQLTVLTHLNQSISETRRIISVFAFTALEAALVSSLAFMYEGSPFILALTAAVGGGLAVLLGFSLIFLATYVLGRVLYGAGAFASRLSTNFDERLLQTLDRVCDERDVILNDEQKLAVIKGMDLSLAIPTDQAIEKLDPNHLDRYLSTLSPMLSAEMGEAVDRYHSQNPVFEVPHIVLSPSCASKAASGGDVGGVAVEATVLGLAQALIFPL